MRRYHGFIADSARWQHIALRPGDIIVATPSKCGTTWMQNIVAMLLHDATELEVPISVLCPWIDMNTHAVDELVAGLEAQAHRRAMKSHTALDGIPDRPGVTYITVFRHPLDAALSNRDHFRNTDIERTMNLRGTAVGLDDLTEIPAAASAPEEPGAYLRWFLSNDSAAEGSGMNNLADYANSLGCAWERRDRANVHLFHYADLERDLDGEMRRVAAALDVPVDEDRWPDFVDAASFDSMKARASLTAPETQTGIWRTDADFYRQGGRRDWHTLLSAEEVSAFEDQLVGLVGDEAAQWALHGTLPPA